MDEQIASEGYEVVHRKYGRGCIVDLVYETTPETKDVRVLFYHSGETITVPVYSLTPASDSVTYETSAGTHGLAITIDDGFYTLYIEPDQQGSGFDIALRAGNAAVDSAHLETTEFL